MKQALIIFARRPAAGRVKTRLTPPLSAEQAATLYECMLFDILARTRELLGVDRLLFHTAEPEAPEYFRNAAPGVPFFPQEGCDLGERMAAAFETAFGLGYDRVAIIGSDSPDLPLAFIKAAFARLAEQGVDAVFGPSEDGGYYLIALSAPHETLFRKIPWSTGEVLAQSAAQAEAAALTVSLLPAWHDVDTGEDLRRPELLAPGNGAPRTREFILKTAVDRR